MALPKITNKQFTILTLLYQFHFVDRIQIQTLLGHKNHRRIHAWLNDLVSKKCVGRIYSNKMPDNTKPAVYHLAKYGRKILQQAQELENKKLNNNGDESNQFVEGTSLIFSTHGLKSSYRDGTRTSLFRLQCLALVDCYIAIKRQTKEKGYSLAYYSRFECYDYDFLEELLPDGFVSQSAKNGRVKEYAIYFITHRLPRRIIRFKLRHMVNFFYEDNWQSDTPPKIRVICSNTPTRNYSKKIIESKLEYYGFPDNIDCKLTTINEFISFGIDGKIWKQPKNNDTY